MPIFYRVVVTTASETTTYDVNHQLEDIPNINSKLGAIPVTKGVATYYFVEGKPTISWSGVAGATLTAYVDTVGFSSTGIAVPGLVPTGAYDADRTYNVNELARQNGTTYISKTNGNKGNAVTNATHWEVFAEKGFQGNGTFYTTSSLTTSTVPSFPISSIVVTSGRVLQVGDMVLVTNETGKGRQYRVNSITGANCTLQFILDIKGIDGLNGLNGTGIFSTAVQLNLTTQTIALADIAWAIPPQVGAMIISTHASSKGVIHRMSSISGTNGNFEFLVNVGGLEGLSDYPTTAQLAASGNSTTAVSAVNVPSGRTLKVGDFLISNHVDSTAIKHRVTSISGANVTSAFFANTKGGTGAQGPAGTVGIVGMPTIDIVKDYWFETNLTSADYNGTFILELFTTQVKTPSTQAATNGMVLVKLSATGTVEYSQGIGMKTYTSDSFILRLFWNGGKLCFDFPFETGQGLYYARGYRANGSSIMSIVNKSVVSPASPMTLNLGLRAT